VLKVKPLALSVEVKVGIGLATIFMCMVLTEMEITEEVSVSRVSTLYPQLVGWRKMDRKKEKRSM
jgi:hypothetical protein